MATSKTIVRTTTPKVAAKSAKVAAKPVAAKSAPKARTTRAAQAPKVANPLASVKFLTTNRPGAGNMLASYSAAWMSVTGFDTGTILPRSAMLAIAGETAVKYHLKTGNFKEVATGMQITAQGKLHFAGKSEAAQNRNIRPIPEFVECFKAFFTNGELSANVGMKNETFRKASGF